LKLEKVHSDLTAVQLNELAFNFWSRKEHTLFNLDITPQTIFGYMVELALPIVESYFSDLYHDVEEIQRRDWSNPQIFYYCIGPCGTNMVDNRTEAEMYQGHGRETAYKMTYTYHPKYKKAFQLIIERLPNLEDK